MQEICVTTALHLIAERSSGAIFFCHFQKRVQVDVKSLKRKPDLTSHLQRLGLDNEGTVRTLKDRLKGRSYYTVPESTIPLSTVSFRAPLPAEQVTPETERQIKE